LQSSDKEKNSPLAFRVSQFCEQIGLGKSAFYERVKDGRIRTIRIGGRRLVPADEVARLLREGCP
jgi:excisionase family DNA binding protein